MFVLLKGATKEQSFKIGQEIAEAVTATNPKPVKLKFEKVRKFTFLHKKIFSSICNLYFLRHSLILIVLLDYNILTAYFQREHNGLI